MYGSVVKSTYCWFSLSFLSLIANSLVLPSPVTELSSLPLLPENCVETLQDAAFLPHPIFLCQPPIARRTFYLGPLSTPKLVIFSPSCTPLLIPQSYPQHSKRCYSLGITPKLKGDWHFLHPMDPLSPSTTSSPPTFLPVRPPNQETHFI